MLMLQLTHSNTFQNSPPFSNSIKMFECKSTQENCEIHSTPKESIHFEFHWVSTQNLHHVGPDLFEIPVIKYDLAGVT